MTCEFILPDAIQWHEGMLLSPQHFQQAAARGEILLQYHTAAIAPFHWGLRRFACDQNSLISGLLRITELEAVMPDGLVVTYDPSQDEELTLDLTPYGEEMRVEAMQIHLAVAARSADTGKGHMARYRSVEGEPVTDENTGERPQRIPRLRPHMMLLAGKTPPKKYASFPLLTVVFRNEVFTAAEFIPPCLNVSLNSPLGTICSQVAASLREKAMFLSEQVRSPAASLDMPLVLENKTLLQAMVAALPHFEALLYSSSAHPYQLYLALCQLSGQVAGMGSSLVPPLFAPYNHNDLRASFEQVSTFVTQTLTEAVSVSYRGIHFRFADGVFSLDFHKAWQHKRLVIGLRGQPGMTEKDLLNWGEECLIASRNRLQTLRENRILGADRQQVAREGDLVPTRGVVLFSLAADSEFIEPDQPLQIFNASEYTNGLRPAEIILFIMSKADNAVAREAGSGS